jgi:hypothetical protein
LFSHEDSFTEKTAERFIVKFKIELQNKLSKSVFKLYNMTNEFKTSSKNFGFNGFIYDGFSFMPDNSRKRENSTYRLIFHPSYELSTEDSQQFLMNKEQAFTFLITPLMKTIDESLVGMSPKRFEDEIEIGVESEMIVSDGTAIKMRKVGIC